MHVIAWSYRLADRNTLKVEYFDKRTSKPPARRESRLSPFTLVPDLRADEIEISPEWARARGFDVYVDGEINDTMRSWFSYSWSQVDENIGEQKVPRSWDQRHAFAAGFSMDYRRWGLDAVLTGRSSWPVTPVLAAATPLGISLGARNSEREGTYLTLDLKAERRFALSRGELLFTVEVTNVTNRENLCCREIEIREAAGGGLEARVKRVNWLPAIPYLSLAWEF
jgi:hypothetical protein